MKLGFLTACLPGWPLERIAEWAQAQGYEALEVGVWPAVGGREFEASHLPVATWSEADKEATLALFERTGLELSSLAFYENQLHPNLDIREGYRNHLKAAIRAAESLGVPTVGTFVGRNTTLSIRDNMREAERVFPELVDYAGERGVKLIVENCVMEGWHPDGAQGTITYSPELWEWMFGLGLYLNWDPSHLTWIGIDPVETILPYADKILHAQAKDVELNKKLLNRYGFFGKIDKGDNPWDMGWWRYRIPGLGQVDFPRVVDRLYEAGFNGVLSVEHEDPLWGGTEEKVLIGLEIAYRTLRPLVVA
jgi:sugar phosphate isomerase/epimerase